MDAVGRIKWLSVLPSIPGVNPWAVCVATQLALYANGTSGCCHPSLATIAAGAGMTRRAVHAALTALETAGALTLTRTTGGRGMTHRYRLRMPPRMTGESSVSETVQPAAPFAEYTKTETVQLSTPKRCSQLHLNQ